MKKIFIVGLGNPGRKFEHTRHNIGFRVVDALAKECGIEFKKSDKLKSEVAEITPSLFSPLSKGGLEGVKLILAKPQTFMNNSGEAVRLLLSDFPARPAGGRLPTSDVLIVHDDIDLPFGKKKLYGPGGSSAGHKGVDSIIKTVGFGLTRLRLGIENRPEFRVPETETYVLENFTNEEEEILQKKIIPAALEEIKKFLSTNV